MRKTWQRKVAAAVAGVALAVPLGMVYTSPAQAHYCVHYNHHHTINGNTYHDNFYGHIYSDGYYYDGWERYHHHSTGHHYHYNFAKMCH